MKSLEPIVYPRDEHTISRHHIDPDALKIMYRLVRSGFKAFLVGGGVRDLLLGKRPKDFDISTDATPRRIKSLFRNSRIIGRRFKLVHIYFRGNKIIEVSTFRAENEVGADDLDGRASTDNIYGEESTDALRRDLTINGLFYDISSFSVIDYVGGMDDLKKGMIRVIGDPDVRFKQDPVRLMRVVRHAARNGFVINDACWESLLRNRELIVTSSQVRVYEELRKDMVSGHFLEILKLLVKSGLMDYLLPEISERQAELFAPSSVFCQVMETIDGAAEESPSTTVVLATMALLLIDMEETPDIEESVKKLFMTLSVPRRERERIGMLLDTLRELCTVNLAKVRVNNLIRKPFFKELLGVAHFTKNHCIPPEVTKFLDGLDRRGERPRPHHPRAGRHVNRQRQAR